MATIKEVIEERGNEVADIEIYNMEYDEDGYLHFTVAADDYELEGLYRIYDPDNGESMTLVSIDYGDLHPIIQRQWDRIENALYDATLDRYKDELSKHLQK